MSENTAEIATSIHDHPENWQVAYELKDGQRTGRFRLLNERGEGDLMWPDWWLGERVEPKQCEHEFGVRQGGFLVHCRKCGKEWELA